MSEFVEVAEDFNRMCVAIKAGKTGGHCLFFDGDTCDRGICCELLLIRPEKYMPRVTQWAKDNPKRTYLDDFKEKYPNAPLIQGGRRPQMCIKNVGHKIECKNYVRCIDCWNQEMETIE